MGTATLRKESRTHLQQRLSPDKGALGYLPGVRLRLLLEGHVKDAHIQVSTNGDNSLNNAMATYGSIAYIFLSSQHLGDKG